MLPSQTRNQKPETRNYDVVIIGAGPVGCTLALALAESNLNIALIEARDLTTPLPPSYEERILALSYGSQLILDRIGVWKALSATPIHSIHVSQKNGFGRTLISCNDYDLPALGYVLPYPALHSVLISRLTNLIDNANITCLTGASVSEINPSAEEVSLKGESVNFPLPPGEGLRVREGEGSKERPARHNFHVKAKLVVCSDGGKSFFPKATVRDYQQYALTSIVKNEVAHQHRAWERFTSEGPLALLPLQDKLALIWTTTQEKAQHLCELPEKDFLDALHQHFGHRLGKFTSVGKRTCFPLQLAYHRSPIAQRVALLGNAAQSLHPVAGQGLNMGLRDAWELAEILFEHAETDIGSQEILKHYQSKRRLDRAGGTALTDALVRLFSNSIPPVKLLRGLGLLSFDLLPPAREFLAKRMMFGARAF